MKRKAYIIPILAATVTFSSAFCLAGEKHSEERGEKDQYSESEAREVWREGKIESALLINTHLNNFKIDVDVKGDEATLSGKVDSAVERDLAGEIALSIDGIESVENNLDIVEETAQGTSAVKDAAITAMVNVRLMANDDVSSADIDVDTSESVVTLKGYVKSDIQRDLAEKIAENVSDVKSVDNELKLAGS